MKKTIIKCDKCGVETDYDHSTEKNCEYYEIRKEFIAGWCGIDYSLGADNNFQICKKCFNLLKINR